jgi:NAD(P)-dependent dehydrogenase (short-subunit alcohol dehydrogenase family)
MSKIAFVSGVGKKSGIGFEIVRGLLKNKDFQVIFNARDEGKGKEILTLFQNDDELKGKAHLFVGDLVKTETLDALKKLIHDKFENKLHVLVNNAGSPGKLESFQTSILDTTKEDIFSLYEVNALVPIYLAKLFVPLMKEQKYGRIVNVSSRMGQLTEMGSGGTPYRLSKVGMNAFTKILDAELKSENILVNSMCPGFVKSEFSAMNVNAPRTSVEGADTAIWLATVDDNGPRGKFYGERNELQW